MRYGDGLLWHRDNFLPGGDRGPGGPRWPDGPGGPGVPGGPGGLGGPLGPGFGGPWGVTRYWLNVDCAGVQAASGPGSEQGELPHVRRVNGNSDDQIYVMSDGINVRKFSDPTGAGPVKTYQVGSFYLHNQELFQHDTGTAKEFVLRTTTGT